MSYFVLFPFALEQIGTHGNNVVDRLQVALNAWSAAHGGKAVKVVRKVSDHFCAVCHHLCL